MLEIKIKIHCQGITNNILNVTSTEDSSTFDTQNIVAVKLRFLNTYAVKKLINVKLGATYLILRSLPGES